MQKPLAYDGQGLLLDKNSISRILSQSPTKNQVVSELLNYIADGSLTDALHLLEKCRITGGLAIFIISNLHTLGGGEA